MILRKIEKNMCDEVFELVRDVFMQFEAPDYTDEGIETFFKISFEDKKFMESLTVYGAFDNEKLAGIIATRSEGTHIALFFIKSEYQKKGIGRMLFEKVLSECPSDYITVNSSPYAHEIYRHFGFYDTDFEKSFGGVRFFPMKYDVL